MLDTRPILTALFIGATLIGCTPRLDQLQSDPALDYDALQTGGVVVLPAISHVADVSPGDGQYLLVDRARDWRGGIPMSTVDDSVEADDVAAAVALDRALPKAAARAIADASGARFIAVVQLHDYTTRYTEVNDTYVDEDGYAYTDTTLTAEAELDGEVALIETETLEIWWRGADVERDDNEVSYSDSSWDGYDATFPEPPGPYEMTGALLETMVRNWPDES